MLFSALSRNVLFCFTDVSLCLLLFFSISHEAVVSRAGGAAHPDGLLQAVCQ